MTSSEKANKKKIEPYFVVEPSNLFEQKFFESEIFPQKVVLPLNKSFQKICQDVNAKPHNTNVFGCTIDALTVFDRTFEHIGEFVFATEVIWTNEINHTPVFQHIIL